MSGDDTADSGARGARGASRNAPLSKDAVAKSGAALSNDAAFETAPFDFRSVRLRTLVTLRWLTIGGQAAGVAAASIALGVDLPLAACAAAISVPIWLNVISIIASTPNQRLTERDALLTLIFDTAQLASILFLTGGLTNPFALFLLAPVTIAASVLSLRTTIVLAAISIAAATLLSQQYVPLTFADGTTLDPPALYVAGYWLAITLGVAFQAGYARRVSVEAFNMSAALTATQMALEREQRLSEIGALAAAAAHELGTPLATIKLVASELRKELQHDAELADDATLIVDQATRCRGILERLSTERAPVDAQIRSAPISAVLEEAAGPHLDRRSEIVMRLNGRPIDAAGPAQPLIPRRPEIIHGLRNFIQNAVDFAASTVWIDVEISEEALAIIVSDDGGGFSADIIEQLGEPFATTRGKSRPDLHAPDAYQGMGLGVFISKRLLERTGAEVFFENGADRRRSAREAEDRPIGAIVRVVWPRPVTTTGSSARLMGRARDETEPPDDA